MTERERIEREVILDILLESSRWERSGNDMDSIRAEVTDRARRLLGIQVKPADSMSVLERGAARAAEKQNRHGKMADGKRRVNIDGRKVTVDESLLVKEPYKCSPTGYRWKIRDEVMQGQTVPMKDDGND
jgi:hypothetical protein